MHARLLDTKPQTDLEGKQIKIPTSKHDYERSINLCAHEPR